MICSCQIYVPHIQFQYQDLQYENSNSSIDPSVFHLSETSSIELILKLNKIIKFTLSDSVLTMSLKNYVKGEIVPNLPSCNRIEFMLVNKYIFIFICYKHSSFSSSLFFIFYVQCLGTQLSPTSSPLQFLLFLVIPFQPAI